MHSPAMEYRLGLEKGRDYDIRHSHIEIHYECVSDRYVRTVLPISDYPDSDLRNKRYTTAARTQAALLWLEKYGVDIPNEDDIEVYWAETLMAKPALYDGALVLSASELEVVNRAAQLGDFTLDMLWLILELLDWRPGKPVAEDDLGWIAVWAENEEVGGYLDIVRAVLCMPEVSYDWTPPAVASLLNDSK